MCVYTQKYPAIKRGKVSIYAKTWDKPQNDYTKLKTDTEAMIPFLFKSHSRTNPDRKQLSKCLPGEGVGWDEDILDLHNGSGYTAL